MCNDAFRPAKIHIILKMTKRNARNIWSFSKYLLYLRANTVVFRCAQPL